MQQTPGVPAQSHRYRTLVPGHDGQFEFLQQVQHAALALWNGTSETPAPAASDIPN